MSDHPTLTLGRAVRLIRDLHRETQRAMATTLGISHVHLCNLENGKAEPSLALLAEFDKYYRLNPYLLARMSEERTMNHHGRVLFDWRETHGEDA